MAKALRDAKAKAPKTATAPAGAGAGGGDRDGRAAAVAGDGAVAAEADHGSAVGAAAVKISEGDAASADKPNPAAAADAAGVSSGPGESPSGADARPVVSGPAGTVSRDDAPQEPDHGAGDPAGPADVAFDAAGKRFLDAVRAGTGHAAALARLKADIAEIASGIRAAPEETVQAFSSEEVQFAAKYPKLSAAVEAFRAANPDRRPTAMRIAAKAEGFRRAGIAHSTTPTDHPVEKFRLPEQAELLLGEPELIVELI